MPRLPRHSRFARRPIISLHADDRDDTSVMARGYMMKRPRERSMVSLREESLAKLSRPVGILLGRADSIEPTEFPVSMKVSEIRHSFSVWLAKQAPTPEHAPGSRHLLLW